MYDIGADGVQEVAVVRDDHQRLLPAHEVFLEPQHGAQVQMVGGLVQEKKRGLDEESAREGDAHAPAAAEGLGGSALRLGKGFSVGQTGSSQDEESRYMKLG